MGSRGLTTQQLLDFRQPDGMSVRVWKGSDGDGGDGNETMRRMWRRKTAVRRSEELGNEDDIYGDSNLGFISSIMPECLKGTKIFSFPFSSLIPLLPLSPSLFLSVSLSGHTSPH